MLCPLGMEVPPKQGRGSHQKHCLPPTPPPDATWHYLSRIILAQDYALNRDAGMESTLCKHLVTFGQAWTLRRRSLSGELPCVPVLQELGNHFLGESLL